MLRIRRAGVYLHPWPLALHKSEGRGFVLVGLVLLGVVGLVLWLAAAAQADSSTSLNTPTATPNGSVSPKQVQVSSAYTTGGILFDGQLALDGNIGTGWISDPAQPPQGQWIEAELEPGAEANLLQLINYTTAMRYSRPQTTTLLYSDGMTMTLAWADSSQDQLLRLPKPATGRVRLTIDSVWGNNTQPVGIAEFVPFTEKGRLGWAGPLTPIPTSVNPLPTPPPITGPTSTAPDTVAVTATTALPASDGNGTDPWRWWLIGVMVLLAGFFLLRGLRRQRGR